MFRSTHTYVANTELCVMKGCSRLCSNQLSMPPSEPPVQTSSLCAMTTHLIQFIPFLILLSQCKELFYVRSTTLSLKLSICLLHFTSWN